MRIVAENVTARDGNILPFGRRRSGRAFAMVNTSENRSLIFHVVFRHAYGRPR